MFVTSPIMKYVVTADVALELVLQCIWRKDFDTAVYILQRLRQSSTLADFLVEFKSVLVSMTPTLSFILHEVGRGCATSIPSRRSTYCQPYFLFWWCKITHKNQRSVSLRVTYCFFYPLSVIEFMKSLINLNARIKRSSEKLRILRSYGSFFSFRISGWWNFWYVIRSFVIAGEPVNRSRQFISIARPRLLQTTAEADWNIRMGKVQFHSRLTHP